ncbi:proline dehydrogenase [Embleya scabrispora]|uniref:Proline dehydrogenase n=1 Tax=Embleya scabrispora TaxID=159449 RepID=A0A1T3P422_9ACTN|nr:(2Fe-2S)-binding protein [Embleya scabrispora]OPC83764.1 proline dehydrogenase [Embleya scabrispora]
MTDETGPAPLDRTGDAGFHLTVDGRRIPVEPGQTVGAAMLAAGIRSWRTTRFAGRPRGLFCGIGVCFDCLVTVDGTPSLRACLVTARPDDEVTTS